MSMYACAVKNVNHIYSQPEFLMCNTMLMNYFYLWYFCLLTYTVKSIN